MTINSWGSDDPAQVAKGGTGNATLTDHGILLGSGTAAVTPTAAPTDGQLLIGSTGVDPVLALPTGDANEIAIGSGAGSLSIGIADNPVLPGVESVTIPAGTTAQEPSPVDGMLRYDSTTDRLRAVVNGVWVDVGTGTSAGSWVFLSEMAFSSGDVTFDSSIIAAPYVNFAFFWKITTGTLTTDPFAQVSPDNGSTIRATGYTSIAGVDQGENIFSNALFLILTSGASTTFSTGQMYLLDPLSSSKNTYYTSNGALFTSSSRQVSQGAGFYSASTEAHNWIRFTFAPTSATGSMKVYGITE